MGSFSPQATYTDDYSGDPPQPRVSLLDDGLASIPNRCLIASASWYPLPFRVLSVTTNLALVALT